MALIHKIQSEGRRLAYSESEQDQITSDELFYLFGTIMEETPTFDAPLDKIIEIATRSGISDDTIEIVKGLYIMEVD